MKRVRLVLAVAVATLLSASSPAVAHDFWIEPTSFRPAIGESVGIALRFGDRMAGEPLPRPVRRIVRFESVAPGEAPVVLAGSEGDDPAGRFVPRAPGLHWALYQGNRAQLELAAEKFEAHLREQGLERVIELRAQLGESDRPGREGYTRSALAALCVPGEAATPPALAPLGLTLELVPESDPCGWRAGDELPLRLLLRGAPLAGTRVVALHPERLDAPPAAITDAQGRVRLPLDRPGAWMIKAVAAERSLRPRESDWETNWASLRAELTAR